MQIPDGVWVQEEVRRSEDGRREKYERQDGRVGWENEGASQLARQTDREVVSLYQEHTALAGSSLSVVVPLIQSAAASASEAPGWAKTP